MPLPNPPPTKKRKRTHQIEEISFDNTARHEYLTGFHKRKLQRVQNAKEQAEKRAKEERIIERRRIRETRKEELKEHVESINAMLRPVSILEDDANSWSDSDDDKPTKDNTDTMNGGDVNRDEEYVDEDKYTTVTISSMDPADNASSDDDDDNNDNGNVKDGKRSDGGGGGRKSTKDDKDEADKKKKDKKPKVKKKKFRYQSKTERREDNRKIKSVKAKRRGERKEKK